MEFRLARKEDLTPDLCREIFSDALAYCKEVPEDVLTPGEVMNFFVNFCEGRITNPQFWLAFKGGKFVGYMITQAILKDKMSGVNITQAYIHPDCRANGVAPYCMDVLSQKAKASGAQMILCQRYGEADGFGRMLKKFGYSYRSTEFRKEF